MMSSNFFIYGRKIIARCCEYLCLPTGELKNALNHVGAKFLLSVPALVPVAVDAVKQSPTVKVC